MSTPEEQERAKAAAAKMLAMQMFALEVDRARLAVVMKAMEWTASIGEETEHLLARALLWYACKDLKALELRGPLLASVDEPQK